MKQPITGHPRRRPGPLHALAFVVTAAAALYATARLVRSVARVAANQEAMMSTFDDLSRAVAANAAASNELIADFQALRDQLANLPTDRPINAEEQAALDAAVEAIEARTAAILAVDPPDPSQPVQLGHQAGTQGGVVEMVSTGPTAPTAMTGPQGGVVDLDDDDPAPTAGVPGEAQFVDLDSSQPTELAAEAKRDDDGRVTEPDPGGDHPVTEPAPAAPLSESPGGGGY